MNLLMALYLALAPQVVAEKLAKGDVTVIDVREADEIKDGMLAKAQWLPMSTWESKVASVPKAKPVYVYCRSGGRAGKVADQLRAKGYDAYNLGGYEDLLKQGFTSVKPK